MTFRPVLMIGCAAIVLAACGGDSDGADAPLPDITLVTASPVSTEGDGDDGDGELASASTTPTTEAATNTTTSAVATTSAPEATTTVATPSTEAVTSSDAPPNNGGFVLGADGLGAVPFGADPEQSITFVSSILGAPTADTGWLAPIEIGPCGGTRIRQVSWSQLQLEFGDVSNVTEGSDHFYAYFYGVEGSSSPQPAGLQTAEQIGAGSSVAELLAAYPGATLFQGDEFIAPTFTVNDNLAGRLSGTADADVVEVVIGGIPCDG